MAGLAACLTRHTHPWRSCWLAVDGKNKEINPPWMQPTLTDRWKDGWDLCVLFLFYFLYWWNKNKTRALYILFSVCLSHIAFIPVVYFFIINMTQLHYYDDYANESSRCCQRDGAAAAPSIWRRFRATLKEDDLRKFASPNNIVNPLTHSCIFLLLPMKNVNPALFVFSFRDYLNDIYVASHWYSSDLFWVKQYEFLRRLRHRR